MDPGPFSYKYGDEKTGLLALYDYAVSDADVEEYAAACDDTAVLRWIAHAPCRKDRATMKAILSNPACPAELTEKYSSPQSSSDLAFEVLYNAAVTEDTMLRLAQSAQVKVRRELASDMRATPAVLGMLRSAEEMSIRMSVASNPRTPLRDLEVLSVDSQPSVREAVAQNPAATPAMRVVAALMAAGSRR